MAAPFISEATNDAEEHYSISLLMAEVKCVSGWRFCFRMRSRSSSTTRPVSASHSSLTAETSGPCDWTFHSYTSSPIGTSLSATPWARCRDMILTLDVSKGSS